MFFPAFHPIVRGVQLGLSLFAEAEQNCREALRLEPDSREAVMRLGRKNLLRFLGASHGRPTKKLMKEPTDGKCIYVIDGELRLENQWKLVPRCSKGPFLRFASFVHPCFLRIICPQKPERNRFSCPGAASGFLTAVSGSIAGYSRLQLGKVLLHA